MSKDPKKVRAYKRPTKPGRGPNGRRFCRQCDTEVPEGRLTFCSEGCIHEYRLRSDMSYLRDQVFLRDQGVCALCGINTTLLVLPQKGHAYWETKGEIDSLKAAYQEFLKTAPPSGWNPETLSKSQDYSSKIFSLVGKLDRILLSEGDAIRKSLIADGWPVHRVKYGKTLWDADHILPVVEGGGNCGLDNIRTLCCICHNAQTKELAGRRKKARRSNV